MTQDTLTDDELFKMMEDARERGDWDAEQYYHDMLSASQGAY